MTATKRYYDLFLHNASQFSSANVSTVLIYSISKAISHFLLTFPICSRFDKIGKFPHIPQCGAQIESGFVLALGQSAPCFPCSEHGSLLAVYIAIQIELTVSKWHTSFSIFLVFHISLSKYFESLTWRWIICGSAAEGHFQFCPFNFRPAMWDSNLVWTYFLTFSFYTCQRFLHIFSFQSNSQTFLPQHSQKILAIQQG